MKWLCKKFEEFSTPPKFINFYGDKAAENELVARLKRPESITAAFTGASLGAVFSLLGGANSNITPLEIMSFTSGFYWLTYTARKYKNEHNIFGLGESLSGPNLDCKETIELWFGKEKIIDTSPDEHAPFNTLSNVNKASAYSDFFKKKLFLDTAIVGTIGLSVGAGGFMPNATLQALSVLSVVVLPLAAGNVVNSLKLSRIFQKLTNQEWRIVEPPEPEDKLEYFSKNKLIPA